MAPAAAAAGSAEAALGSDSGDSVPPRASGSPRAAASARARLARAWYSGPCLRGSAYSRGLSVQYVPDDVPYQLAPVQPGSNGSPSTPS